MVTDPAVTTRAEDGCQSGLVRRPAHAAGFANLYDFMDRSFRVMKPVPSVGRLLERIAAREARIMDRLFDRHPAPFKDVPNE